jgi:hypothetical protein
MPCLLAVIQLTAIYNVPLCTHLVIDRSRPQLTIDRDRPRSILSSATTVDRGRFALDRGRLALDRSRPRSIVRSIVRSTAVDRGRVAICTQLKNRAGGTLLALEC